jgi:hypothetical protein
MRGSNHSREFWLYESTASGIVIGNTLREYDRVVTGLPRRQRRSAGPARQP